MKSYDAIIIGSGQAGTPLSKKLAKLGWKTALIEKQQVGGTCVNVGCTPTKTMIASAKRIYDCKNSAKFGVHATVTGINIKEILARKDKVVNSFRRGAEKGLEKTENLDLIFGIASFTGDKELKVILNTGAEEELTADKIFIDVGTRPSIPKIKGLNQIDYLTSTTLMELEEVPDHLLIVGGGYIGLEFGQMYRRFGSQVTIVESDDRFLAHEDEDIAACIQEILEAEDIKIITAARVNHLKKEGRQIMATIKTGDEEKQVTCSHVLIAVGRTYNTDQLNLESTGIKVNNKGFVEVNEQLETSVKDVYALGDVKGGPEFTHISYNDHLVIFKNLTEDKNKNYQDRLVPYTMFTDPQLGRVGITENEAKEKGLDYRVATFSMENVARAIEMGDTRGMMKAIVDNKSAKILGVAIIAEQGGEIMTVLQMAMVGGVDWHQIRELPIAHPLYSESLNNLFMQMEDQ